ncbi:MAG: glycosyltransferase family 39 protein [Armatimonadetes bacterium]|nr:glycosyltransferase family 39 protein [Armatimonadota bacterium]MDE2207473.1 glycosyltransferase family 39 protein [Armatimonadota bacterium]
MSPPGPSLEKRLRSLTRITPTRALAAAITLIGLALRLWGITWSLPTTLHPWATYHPDETINLQAAEQADIPHVRLDIGFYNYGAFDFYLVSLAQTIARGYGLVPAVTTPPAEPTAPRAVQAASAMEANRAQRRALFLCGRLVSVLLGTLTIPLVYLLGLRVYNRKAGAAAALLYAFAPLAALHAHFFTVDVPATFFVAGTLLAAERMTREASGRAIAVAAVWCGLAAATKYTAAMALVAPATALYLCPGLVRRARIQRLAALGAGTAAVFLVACPGIWLNWHAFWYGSYPGEGVRYELLVHSRTGHGLLFVHTGSGWWYHLVVSLPFGLGVPLLLAALAGCWYALARRTPAEVAQLAFVAVTYLVTGFSQVRFARYMLPLFPPLCVLAGGVLFAPYTRPACRIAARIAAAMALVTTGVYGFTLVRLLTLPDPRDRAAAWLNLHAPPAASVAFAETPWFFAPPLSPLLGAPDAPARAMAAAQCTRYRLLMPAAEWDAGALKQRPNYVVLSNFETMHAVYRLHLAYAMAFMNAIPKDYARHLFASPRPWLMPSDGPLIPDDLLYVMPRITVYARPGSS